MKKPAPFIPPPAHGSHMRLAPVGKHAIGIRKRGRQAKIAFKALHKAAFIAEGQREANVIAKGKADARTFREWIATLSPEDAAFARAHGLHKPMPSDGFRRGGGEDALDLAEREIIPEADIQGTRNGKPIVAVRNAAIEAMEPEALLAEVGNLSAEEVLEAVDDFGDALRWALEGRDLVALGQRSLVMIAALRPDLAEGLPIDLALARDFLESFHDFRLSETLARLQSTGTVYARVFAWMLRSSSYSSLGERLQLVAYALRPDLIDASTLAQLGAPANKTRQAIDKIALDLRDTFGGLVAYVMRGDFTRLRCRAAQLA